MILPALLHPQNNLEDPPFVPPRIRPMSPRIRSSPLRCRTTDKPYDIRPDQLVATTATSSRCTALRQDHGGRLRGGVGFGGARRNLRPAGAPRGVLASTRRARAGRFVLFFTCDAFNIPNRHVRGRPGFSPASTRSTALITPGSKRPRVLRTTVPRVTVITRRLTAARTSSEQQATSCRRELRLPQPGAPISP